MNTIIHVDMDAFFAAVEQLYRPELRGKPVIVGGDPDGRSVVSAASYEARVFGVHSAMPMAWARKLCPQGVFLPGDGKKYGQVSRLMFGILEEFTPDVEEASVDEAYLDVTGCERLFGPPLAMAHAIRLAIRERLGLSASIGVATSRSVAKIASELAKPDGLLLVPPGREADFLAPLPVERMPGIGETTSRRLRGLGIRTLGDLTLMDDTLLARVFGKYGPLLREKAAGRNHDGLREFAPRKSMGKETTFPRDMVDRPAVGRTLALLTEKVCRKLRAEGLAARTVTVKLRYSDFQTVSRAHTFDTAVFYDSIIIPAVWDLFQQLDSRRTGIRLVGVSLSRLQTAVRQWSLFDAAAQRKQENLCRGLDLIRDRFGFTAIGVASRLA
ncbi:MAG: DNA polymerase IV [Acidobacteria bacterium]|nr:DNA polymerase IV [Acidobacteriota bacterium]